MTIVKRDDDVKSEKDVKSDTKRVVVYGSLRKGLHNHRLLETSKYLGEFESEPEFNLYSVGESYPGLVPGGTTSVIMEVYEVDDEVAENVDTLEGYYGDEFPEDNFYNKVKMDTPYGEASSYHYNEDVSDLHLVESGDWVKYKKLSQLVNSAQC